MPRLRAIPLLALATSLVVLPVAFAQNTNTARPGTINYVEGQATLNGQPLSARSGVELGQGESVATQNGKVEILLTPGVFLRLGDNSAVTMVSPDLTKTEVQLDRGIAEVEVDQLYQQNDLLIDQGPAQSTLLKPGLYEFDATAGKMRVFDGEAAVSQSQSAKKWIKVKDHHEIAMNGEAAKSQDFNGQQAANQDSLYNWSKLRADYLGRANLNLAQEYAGNPGLYPGVYSGWMWDPALYGYTWLPGDGLFWSPFGYGFYSPWYLYGGGFIYPAYGFGGRYYRGGYGFRGPYHGTVGAIRTAPGAHAYAGGGVRGGFAGGGFRGGGGRGGRR